MFTFKVGDPVIFGRPGGEQTIGRVQAIGPKNYKIEQLETRGTKSPRPVGTIWTIPPTLVQKYYGDLPAAVVAPVAPASTPPKGNPFGQQHWNTYAAQYGLPLDSCGKTFMWQGAEYRVVALNPKRPKFPVAAMRCSDLRTFKFDVESIRIALRDSATDGSSAACAAPIGIGVGVPVTYSGYTWGSGKVIEGPVVGVVTAVDVFRDEIEVFSGTDTRHIRRFQGNVKVEPVAKRSEDALRKEFAQVYAMLEPERLTADGERSRGEVAQLRSALNRALRALSQELGRTVSESEAYTASDAYNTERM